MTETTHVCTHRLAKPREERGYITHSAQLAWPNAGGTSDTALMHGYMPIMYFACAGFVL